MKLKAVKGSSLVEVITAMVIISLVFAVTLLIFVNTQHNTRSKARAIAETTAKNVLEKSVAARDLKQGKWASPGFTITKRVSAYGAVSSLHLITIEVTNDLGILVSSYKRLIYVSAV